MNDLKYLNLGCGSTFVKGWTNIDLFRVYFKILKPSVSYRIKTAVKKLLNRKYMGKVLHL